jgi:hypothetical protein
MARRPQAHQATSTRIERPQPARLGMTQRHRERIGGIGGELDLEQQQRAHHLRDLRLGRRAVAGHGHLDGPGAYSCTLAPSEAAAHRATPRACPSFRALSGLRCTNTRSMATVSGRCSATSAAHGGIDALQPHHHVVPATSTQPLATWRSRCPGNR